MHEYKLTVPTRNASHFTTEVVAGSMPECGPRNWPVLIHQAEGIRIVLGTHDYCDFDKPDLLIERQANGWAIFLHPVGGSDASGYVYLLDDGRSFVLPENDLGPTPAIKVLQFQDQIPDNGKVEQHLVGAKLEQRHPDIIIPNQPGNAGDMQTGRGGDFTVGSTCYHVTAAPGGAVIDKCKANLAASLHPVLLVPREQVEKARHLAEDKEVARRMEIIAIEDFIAVNIIEMTKGQQRDFVDMLREIIEKYNRRVAEVETDSSLTIELQ